MTRVTDGQAQAARRDEVRAAMLAGARAMVPAFPANIAWGLVTGVAMAQSGLGLGKSVGLALLAYAGSAQLAALPLLVEHAPGLIAVLTALMVNLRFVIYSAALVPTLGPLPTVRRFLAANLIGDIPFVIYMRHHERLPPASRAPFLVGASVAFFFAWHAGSFTGLLAAGAIPADWGLEFAGMLALVALLVPMLATRPGLAGALVAGLAGIAARALPAHSGLMVATLAGIVAALVADRWRGGRP